MKAKEAFEMEGIADIFMSSRKLAISHRTRTPINLVLDDWVSLITSPTAAEIDYKKTVILSTILI